MLNNCCWVNKGEHREHFAHFLCFYLWQTLPTLCGAHANFANKLADSFEMCGMSADFSSNCGGVADFVANFAHILAGPRAANPGCFLGGGFARPEPLRENSVGKPNAGVVVKGGATPSVSCGNPLGFLSKSKVLH